MADLEDALMTGETVVAPNPNQSNYRPAYSVRKLPGKVDRTIIKRNAKTKRLEKTVVQEDAGFILMGMKRKQGVPLNSIRVRSLDELRRLGVSNDVPLVNEVGEQVGTVAL